MPCQKCNGHYNKETREFRCTHCMIGKDADFITSSKLPRWNTLKGLNRLRLIGNSLDFSPETYKFYFNDKGKNFYLEQKIREIFVGCILF